jgi:hypothetical protein
MSTDPGIVRARVCCLLLAVALAAFACNRDATRGLREDIAAKTAAELGVEVDAVECPRTIDRTPGAELECVAVVDGGERLPIDVRHVGDGEVRWVLRGVIRLAEVERMIEARIAAAGGEAKVDCGGTVKASVPGSRFECAVRRSDGTSDGMVVVVRDWAGTVNLEVR